MKNAVSDINSWLGMTQGCFVIAEIGVNHNGDIDMARRLIDVAADAGADAAKFQTFFADQLVTQQAAKAAYQIANDGDTDSQIEMLRRLEFSEKNLAIARDHCAERGVKFLSTPFGERAADLLEDLGVDGFKVSSGDLTHLPFLRHLAAKNLPIIISTGMATLGETEDAVVAIRESGNPPLAILHCVSNYPAAYEESNLRAMDTLAAAFGKPVGWSDHTVGDAIALAAVARGARILEKHYTLDRNLPGPDHAASLEPGELTDLIGKIRAVSSALGDGVKQPQPSEQDTASVARRSIVTARAVRAGEPLTSETLDCKRPGTGLAPRLLPLVLGRKAARDLPADTLLTLQDVS